MKKKIAELLQKLANKLSPEINIEKLSYRPPQPIKANELKIEKLSASCRFDFNQSLLDYLDIMGKHPMDKSELIAFGMEHLKSKVKASIIKAIEEGDIVEYTVSENEVSGWIYVYKKQDE